MYLAGGATDRERYEGRAGFAKEHVFDFAGPPRSPSPTSTRAKVYGHPFGFIPENYPDWPPGTQPSDYIGQ